MHFQGVAVQHFVKTIERLLKALARKHLPAAAQQCQQQGKFLGPQRHALAVAHHRVASGVNHQIAMAQQGGGAAFAAAQGHAHAGQQFLGLEGLDHIIVGSLVQPRHPVGQSVSCGHDQHRHHAARAAQLAKPVQAVAVRQTKVQQHQVKGLHAQCCPSQCQRGRHIHRIAAGPQGRGQAGGNARVVFHNQYPHRPSSIGLSGRLSRLDCVRCGAHGAQLVTVTLSMA